MCLSAERFDYLCLTLCVFVSNVVSVSGSVCVCVSALLGNCGSCSSCGNFRDCVAFSWKCCCWAGFCRMVFSIIRGFGS